MYFTIISGLSKMTGYSCVNTWLEPKTLVKTDWGRQRKHVPYWPKNHSHGLILKGQWRNSSLDESWNSLTYLLTHSQILVIAGPCCAVQLKIIKLSVYNIIEMKGNKVKYFQIIFLSFQNAQCLGKKDSFGNFVPHKNRHQWRHNEL